MTFQPKRILFSGVAALTLMASAASATPIALVYDGPSAVDPKGVTISTSPIAGTTGGVGAYGFEMTDTLGPLGSFLAWCLDIASPLSTSATDAKPYTITETPFSNSYGLDAAEEGRIQSVFDANFKNLDATDGVSAAGFQVALWNALYDGDLDAAGGTFAVSADAAIIAKANGYLSAADLYDGSKAYNLTFLESNPGQHETKHQNFVTVSAVPLPAAGMMLLAALGGLGFSARRRKAS